MGEERENGWCESEIGEALHKRMDFVIKVILGEGSVTISLHKLTCSRG